MDLAVQKRQISVGVFILAKNEAANIRRSVKAFESVGWPVVVLDSGSTDRTKDIVSEFPFARFQEYIYRDHCTAYNETTTILGSGFDFVIVLDADMVVSETLQNELRECFAEAGGEWKALDAEIEMVVDGVPLKRASLYPPKPFVFKVGEPLFMNTGHAEKLRPGIPIRRLCAKLRHDDRKNYDFYLQSQFRYSGNLLRRYRAGEVSGRDKLRVRWPFLIFAVPIFSYFFKGGFMDGRAGMVYALDRLIAEAIMYRQALSSRIVDSSADE